MAITNQIIIEAVDGRVKTLKPLLSAMVGSVLREKGCQKHELYPLDEERESFFIIEVWKDKKQYKAHLQKKKFKSISDKLKALLEIEVTNPLKLIGPDSKEKS